MRFPVTLPGHWDTIDGKAMATEYASKNRADLAMPNVSDFSLANAQFMVSRQDLEIIAYQTAAKERIRWLSAQLAVAKKAEELVDGVKEFREENPEDGFWRSCTGCHETNEGYDTGPYSAAFGCALGMGCGECGGIGAVWDNTDYPDMVEFMKAADRDHENVKRILVESGIPSHKADNLAIEITGLDSRPDAKNIAAAAVQSACESDPADPEHPDTICISTDDFETIVRCAVENWAETKALDALPKAPSA